ncbi:unnamed protein product [Paramecium primaurelia]|uniref:OTU domain-containing protein n=1 Tax=Paramecium primaurelia TaxID=5886 RepID=A0A8S1NJ24_PARPR|nr:unnamed protein product [Paramecium primaurelia]
MYQHKPISIKLPYCQTPIQQAEFLFYYLITQGCNETVYFRSSQGIRYQLNLQYKQRSIIQLPDQQKFYQTPQYQTLGNSKKLNNINQDEQREQQQREQYQREQQQREQQQREQQQREQYQREQQQREQYQREQQQKEQQQKEQQQKEQQQKEQQEQEQSEQQKQRELQKQKELQQQRELQKQRELQQQREYEQKQKQREYEQKQREQQREQQEQQRELQQQSEQQKQRKIQQQKDQQNNDYQKNSNLNTIPQQSQQTQQQPQSKQHDEQEPENKILSNENQENYENQINDQDQIDKNQRQKLIYDLIKELNKNSSDLRQVQEFYKKYIQGLNDRQELIKQYNVKKLAKKQELYKICNGFLQVRGDGNCFYTAFGYQFIRHLLITYNNNEFNQFINKIQAINLRFRIQVPGFQIDDLELEKQILIEFIYQLQQLRMIEDVQERQQQLLIQFSEYQVGQDGTGFLYTLSTLFFRNLSDYLVEQDQEIKTFIGDDQKNLLIWETECNSNEIVINQLAIYLQLNVILIFFDNEDFIVRQYQEENKNKIILLIKPGHYNIGIENAA